MNAAIAVGVFKESAVAHPFAPVETISAVNHTLRQGENTINNAVLELPRRDGSRVIDNTIQLGLIVFEGREWRLVGVVDCCSSQA